MHENYRVESFSFRPPRPQNYKDETQASVNPILDFTRLAQRDHQSSNPFLDIKKNPFEKLTLTSLNKPEYSINTIQYSQQFSSRTSKELNTYPLPENLIPSQLESHQFSRDIDLFISEALNSIPPPPPVIWPSLEGIIPRVRKQRRFISSTGLRTTVGTSMNITNIFTVSGQPMLMPGDEYTKVDFTPEGRTSFKPDRITDSLHKGITGITQLLQAIDSGEVETPSVFLGHTNINMALIAQRLGFKIIDQHRNPDGTIVTGRSTYIVIGKLEDIRAKIKELTQKGKAEKLAQRQAKLTDQSPQLGLSPA